jgi:hypothetical protein
MTEACRAHLEYLLWIVALGWSLILLIAMFVYFSIQLITSVQHEHYYRYKDSKLKTVRCMMVSKNCSCVWLLVFGYLCSVTRCIVDRIFSSCAVKSHSILFPLVHECVVTSSVIWQRTWTGSTCKYANELLHTIKCGEIWNQLWDYEFLERGCSVKFVW